MDFKDLPGWHETPYEYREYPKWVNTAMGPVIAQNADEEQELLARLPVVEKKRGRPRKEE